MATSSLSTGAARGRRSAGVSVSAVLNLLGVIVGGGVALTALFGMGNAPLFFCGVAGAFFCLDAVRQSW